MPFIYLKTGKIIPFIENEKLRAIILCEGKGDAEILKDIVEKLDVPSRGNVAVTDCGGISMISEMADSVARVARISKALKKIAVMVDANDQTFEQRIEAFKNSLKDHGVNTDYVQEITESLHVVKGERIDIAIKIAGVMNLPFAKHTIEDHTVQLLMLEGKIKHGQLRKANSAKEIIQSKEFGDIIGTADEENVKRSFKNIIELLKTTTN